MHPTMKCPITTAFTPPLPLPRFRTHSFPALTVLPSAPIRHATAPYRRICTLNVETPTPKPETPPTSSTSKSPPQAAEKKNAAPLSQVKQHRESARGSVQEDLAWTIGWVCVAAAATAGVAFSKGADRGLEFVTGYIVEYSLSVDNLFVFLLIFRYFNVDRTLQLKALEWGILGAILMRGAMIIVGEELTHHFWWVTLAFGGLLVYSAAQLLLQGGKDEGEQGVEGNGIVQFAKRLLPVSGHFDGERFWTKGVDGKALATPLLLVLLCIEMCDVVFALDSVPAVLGVSDDAWVIYGSNVLAIAGLRSLFFVLSDAIGELRFLKQALAGVLLFVGAKMIGGVVGGVEVGVVQSLMIVVGLLGGGVVSSLAFPGDKS